MNSITTILIALTIIFIIYLLIVLYKNFRKNELDRDIQIEKNVEAKKNNIEEDYSNYYKNLKMIIGIGKKIPAGNAENGWDKKVEIEIKLYDDVVPLTCANFRRLAKGNLPGKENIKYSGSIFHRVIKDFMIQGGDILNRDGSGSISIYGDQFKDENFEIKHSKPGLLSMANSGPNTNGSQFFITTVPTPHLDNKHVVFGEIIKGFSEIKKIENIETDSNDKPYKDVTILEIKEI